MVRGNWQKRVESADARRKEAKQRKQHQEDRRRHKLWVQEALARLDRHRDKLWSFNNHNHDDEPHSTVVRKKKPVVWKLRLWTDALPSTCGSRTWTEDAPTETMPADIPADDEGPDPEDVGPGGARKKRSTSMGGADSELSNNKNKSKLPLGGRARSHSHHWVETSSPTTTTTSTSSGSRHKKKGAVHPRSRAAADQHHAGSADLLELELEQDSHNHKKLPELWMCRSYFFTGKCNQVVSSSRSGGSRKSGGCRYWHCDSNSNADQCSLCQIVMARSKGTGISPLSNNIRSSSKQEQLIRSEQSVQQADGELARFHPGAMEMVFYQEMDLISSTNTFAAHCEDHEDDDAAATKDESKWQPPLITEQVAETLASQHLKLSNVVYMCLNDVLVLDRYRNGGLVYESEQDFVAAVFGVDARHDSSSNGNCESGESSSFRDLPGPMLEHILTFLPDPAVAAVNRVCQTWHQELGLANNDPSPNLWKHLLDRRAWPHPPALLTPVTCQADDDDNDERSGTRFRAQFLQHYSVVRDLHAIERALHALSSGVPTSQQEMAYFEGKGGRAAPSRDSRCVNLCEWSPNRILVGFDDDCSLRLYETHVRPGNNSTSGSRSIAGERVCRELICQRMDPYRNTKRRSCRMTSMGLDEQCIGCLCRVSSNVSTVAAFVLVVMSREDFLLGDSSNSINAAGSADDLSALNVIDVGESVLNYLLSSDEGDHRLLELIDFLSEGNDIGDVEVKVSRKLAACGYGRFMVEASIALPMVDGDGSVAEVIDRRLFLFSAAAGAIVWMGESDPLAGQPRPADEEIILTCLRRPQHLGGSRTSCVIAVSSAGSPTVMVGEMETSGSAPIFIPVEAAQIVRNEILMGPFLEVRRNPSDGLRPITITPTDIVVADTVVQIEDAQTKRHKTFISFYPRFSLLDQPSYATMLITGGLDVVRMTAIRDEHILVVCRRYEQSNAEAGVGEELDEIDGHWFDHAHAERLETLQAGKDNRIDNADTILIALHVPSRREIYRIGLVLGDECPCILEDAAETIGVALKAGGIVMTGSDVRLTPSDANGLALIVDDTPARSAKKKKKQHTTRSGKKDGFCRGMSLSG